jgi:large subunit ribosomal protein L29
MASSLAAHELDDMNGTDLEARLREAKEELFNLRFQAATGQLESHGRLRTVKRDIARIYTVVRERELGIRSTPGSDESEKAPSEEAPSEEAPSEKAPSEKAQSEKTQSEKTQSEKTQSEKAQKESADA